jgi:hypothetical protein
MGRKYHVQRREFLNKYTTWRAYIIASVEDTSERTNCCDQHNESSRVFFELASCTEQLELHFSLETAHDRENSLHKATKLAEIVNEFRNALEKEIRIIEERSATKPHARAAGSIH